tara:strand:+ start:82 stop:324 length:243 start_codon:yes stop_codon:yes gene_type:complete
MSNLLVKFDLITAERISGYLKERICELQEYAERSTAHHPSHHNYALLIQELRELKIHIDGDLNSMLNDMEAKYPHDWSHR